MKRILSSPVFYLSIIILIAIGLRLIPIKNIVFPDSIWFIGPDSWYHMRLAEYTLANWTQVLTYDPYMMGNVGYMPLETWIIVGITKVLGLFIHNSLLLSYVGAVIPVVTAIFTIIIIYLLVKSLFNSVKVALITALLVSILPTEYLYRTVFGQPDHHCFEVLFTIMSLYFMNWNNRKGWILAGLSTACLMLVWNGGVFFIAIVALWKSVSLLIRDFQSKSKLNQADLDYFIWIGIVFIITVG